MVRSISENRSTIMSNPIERSMLALLVSMSAIHICALNADIAPQRGGLATFSVVQLYKLLSQKKLIYCCW